MPTIAGITMSNSKAVQFVREATKAAEDSGYCAESAEEVLERLGFPVPSGDRVVTLEVTISGRGDAESQFEWNISHDEVSVEDWTVVGVKNG